MDNKDQIKLIEELKALIQANDEELESQRKRIILLEKKVNLLKKDLDEVKNNRENF